MRSSLRWIATLVPLFILIGGLSLLIVWTRISDRFPLKILEIKNEISRVQPSEITDLLALDMKKGFFGIDVEEVQKRVSELPWVEQAYVKRVWPDRLSVGILEKTPQAFWNTEGVLSTTGKVFFPNTLHGISSLLPHFWGPIERVKEIQQQYFVLLEMLGPIGLNIAELFLSEDGECRVVLDNGITVMLGKNALNERLARFVLVYQNLKTKKDDIAYLDLRYTNGISIGWNKTGNKVLSKDLNKPLTDQGVNQ